MKPQRIRDPLHNLVPFRTDQFEYTLWQVIQKPPFQRLRRIRQLGFSELVFPGATHTRYAHSIGVFHTARQLMQIIKRHIDAGGKQFRQHQAEVALAASLVHDVGHGMFSHAFEEVGKKLSLPMARHENVSVLLIRDSDIKGAFDELGSGFANDVASVISSGEPGNLYDAVVSSQFDADRLDYMQRDRLMTGVQSSGIDATWLMSNLEIASVPTGADTDKVGKIETLVLGPKAFQAAESYVLSLFQLYPNVYLHKTTRAAEKVFSSLIFRLITLIREGQANKTGLPAKHPIRRFAENPNKIENALNLDDAVFWGALPMMLEAQDHWVSNHAIRLKERRLPKCIDIRQQLESQMPPSESGDEKARAGRNAMLRLLCTRVRDAIELQIPKPAKGPPLVLVDEARRAPYKKFQDSRTPLNQILIHREKRTHDMAELSPVVASAEAFEVCRAYVREDDSDTRIAVENIIRTEFERNKDANP